MSEHPIADFLDKIIHPNPDDSDPGRPFTPPPSEDKDDDEDDGPSFPMNPALA